MSGLYHQRFRSYHYGLRSLAQTLFRKHRRVIFICCTSAPSLIMRRQRCCCRGDHGSENVQNVDLHYVDGRSYSLGRSRTTPGPRSRAFHPVLLTHFLFIIKVLRLLTIDDIHIPEKSASKPLKQISIVTSKFIEEAPYLKPNRHTLSQVVMQVYVYIVSKKRRDSGQSLSLNEQAVSL